jgi:hypothetical protein
MFISSMLSPESRTFGMFYASNMFEFSTDGKGSHPYLHFSGQPDEFRMDPKDPFSMKPGKMTVSQLAPALLGGGFAVGSYAFVGATEGPAAMTRMAMIDSATNAALYKHHFMPAASKVTKPGAAAAGLISGFFNPKSVNVGLGRRALNTLRYTGGLVGGYPGGAIGGAIGGSIGSAVGGAVPFIGGPMGAVTGMVGNAIGTIGGAYGGAALGSFMATPVGMATTATAGLGIAATAATAATIGGAGYGTYLTLKAGYNYRQNQKAINTSGHLAAFNTQSATTMRARAVQAIHKSHLNARSALGQEANFMSMPSRSYQSAYRRYY